MTYDDDGDAFIYSAGITVSQLSFEHKYEHPTMYSFIYSDILVLNPGTSNVQPVLRTWIEYSGTEVMNIDSITITFDGTSYTFSGLLDTDDIKKSEDGQGYEQEMVLFHSIENLAFMAAITTYLKTQFAAGNFEGMPAVLHGTEDIEIMISSWSLLDLFFIADGYSRAHGLDYYSGITSATALTCE